MIGIICIIIGAGVFLRSACFVYSSDIWFDELFTVELAMKPLSQMLALAAKDVHPPLYYILVRVVYIILHSAFGTDVVAAAKITSLIPYALVLVYLIVFVRKHFGWLSAGLAFVMIAAMPHMSEFMVEARMYSWAAFALFAMFIHAIEWKTSHIFLALLYGIAAMYLHYYGLIGAGVIAVGVLTLAVVRGLRTRRKAGVGEDDEEGLAEGAGPWRMVIAAAVCCVIAIVAYIPWIRVLMGQIGQVSQSYWIQPVTWRTIPGCVKYIFSPEFEQSYVNYICAGIMVASYVFMIVRFLLQRNKERITSIYIYGSAAVLAGVIAAGIVASIIIRPVFVYRYMMPAMFIFWTGFAVLIAKTIEEKPSIVTITIVIVTIVTIGASCVRSFNLFRWGEVRKADGIKQMELALDQIRQDYPDTLIVCNFNHVQALMWYYLENDSVLWGYTDENLIADICGRAPIVMIDEVSDLKEILAERGQSEFLFFGSGNARDEIIEDWKSYQIFTEMLQNSCFLERYYINIYKVVLKSTESNP
ncbi:MAG: hypothetical protein J5509_11340 [Lachnospiraceae bacterium]|nr:hypothetical protein [Lachnospiraceae bacterium]